MPDLSPNVTKARAAGWTDDEIADYLAQSETYGPGFKGARAAGHKDSEILAYLAPHAAPAPAPQLTGREAADADAAKRSASTPGIVRAISNGFTLNHSGELDAASAALETGVHNLATRITGGTPAYGMSDAYHAVLASEDNSEANFAREHPVQNLTGQIVGGVANPLSKAGAAFVGRGTTLVNTALRSAAVGAATGAVAGEGAARGGIADRAKGTAQGAVAGGVVGGAVPVAAQTARVVARVANNALGAPVGSPVQSAMGRLSEALKADGVSPDKIRSAVADWQANGNDAPSLLDVAGNNTLRLIRGAASKPGPAQNVSQDYARQTRVTAAGRGAQRVDQLAPGAPTADEAKAGLIMQRDAAAKTDYAAPYAQPVQMTPEAMAALRGDDGRAAIQRALKGARANQDYDQVGELQGLLTADLDKPPTISAGALDRVRIAMGERGGLAARNGANDIARGLLGRKAGIDTALDATPGLQDARANYRGLTQQAAAVDIGQAIRKTPPDQFAAQVANMSPAEKRAAVLGARQQLKQTFQDRVNAKGTMEEIGWAEDVGQNLKALLGDREANSLIGFARNEYTRLDKAAMQAPNTGSQTEQRSAEHGLMGVIAAVRDPVKAVLDRVAAGLTLNDAERLVLVRAGLSPAGKAFVPRPPPNALAMRFGQAGSRVARTVPTSVAGGVSALATAPR